MDLVILILIVLGWMQAWSIFQLNQLRKGQSMAATKVQLDALLTNVSDNAVAILAAVADLATKSQTANADLLAAIAANGTQDFTSEVATAQTANDNLANVLTAVKAVTDAETAADPGPQPTGDAPTS